MKKIKFENTVIETTRRCNVACAHCLRGEAQDKDIDIVHLEAFFSKVQRVDRLTFSGGEPTLVPNLLLIVMSLIAKYCVSVGHIYMATNAFHITESIVKIFTFIGGLFPFSVEISDDQFHPDPPEANISKLLELPFVKLKHKGALLCEGGFRVEGRGKKVGMNGFDPDDEGFEIRNGNEVNMGEVYLNANGDIISGCNWSYENQEKHKICHVSEMDILKFAHYKVGFYGGIK